MSSLLRVSDFCRPTFEPRPVNLVTIRQPSQQHRHGRRHDRHHGSNTARANFGLFRHLSIQQGTGVFIRTTKKAQIAVRLFLSGDDDHQSDIDDDDDDCRGRMYLRGSTTLRIPSSSILNEKRNKK
mmetsp:Transcript_28384/g.77911  ORF Transcript_28384/g.77911 Transcript_28384/m.77911 type:complete len:126 (+) Transcript_28384:71-448(+)